MKYKSYLILFCLFIISPTLFTGISGQSYDGELVLSKIGQLPTGGDAYDVCVDEEREIAVITCGYYGVRFVNVSDPSNPIELSHIPAPPAAIGTGHATGYAHQFCVEDNIIYVGDGAAGLTVINSTDPSNPIIISDSTEGYAWDIEIQQNIVYVSSGLFGNTAGLLILNATDPANLLLISSYSTKGDITSVEVKGDLAFLADYDNGLIVLDISNVSNPILKGEFSGPENDGISYVEVVDDLVYSTSWGSGLRIWNVSESTEISKVADYSQGETYFSIRVFDDYAFLGGMNDGLIVLNVSNPLNPLEIGRYYEGGRINSAYVVNDLVYVADQDNGLIILNMKSSTEAKWPFQTTFVPEIAVVCVILLMAFTRKQKTA
ncbi:MAG: LVIVD repeat-containing protein [Candidatus Thorarchaeota archaeon]